VSVRLEDSLTVGGCRLDNRLYRAPVLECAGTGPDAPERLAEHLAPAAAAGAGLLFQGATVPVAEGGCVAPGMTRVADPEFVERLSAVPEAVHARGGRVFAQLDHGGLRSRAAWDAAYREDHPRLEQLAVSRPPWTLRLLDRAGVLDLRPRVLSTAEVRELAAEFGRAAARLVDAGYDGVHVAGANGGLVQQFLSPHYNRRTDAFGGDPASRARFLGLLAEEVRDRAGDVPLVTKVPAETAAPPFVRRRVGRPEGVDLAERAVAAGYDAVVPVACSPFWDMSVVRGEYPGRAWSDESLQEGYAAAFGGRLRTRLVALANRVESWFYDDGERAWSAGFARAVRERVDAPVLLEGGIRERGQIDRLLGDACDAVGMARPFYAEPRLPARLLGATDPATRVACRSCNECTVPQAAGEAGGCRTPSVLAERGRHERAGAYER